jgi:hypothetical protein
MSNNESGEHIDDVLEILSNPLTRYILSVLAGVDPGVYTEPVENNMNNGKDTEQSDF